MMQSRKIIWLTLVVFVVFLQGNARSVEASPQDQGQGSGQQQPGSFPVGHATRVLSVPGTRNETRSVNVHLWYPAPDPQNCQSGDGNSQGCPPSVYTSRLNGVPLLPQWDPLSWTIGSTQAFEELPISSAQSSYPVIIFSHGNQDDAIIYAYTLEALASSGFIVAAPDHVNNTQDDVRIDFINAQARNATGDPNFTLIPCFDGLPAPCEVLDRYIKDFGQDPPLDVPCLQVTSLMPPVPPPTQSVRESLKDRVADVSAIIDALPTWFGTRANTSRVGVMGHSRGTVTALAAAGGSTCWGILPDSRVKAVMGLANGVQNVTLAVNLTNVAVPTLLVAGSLDAVRSVSVTTLGKISSNDKALFTIQNAKHRHFNSGFCAQTHSSGVIAQAAEAIAGVPSTTRAILDLKTVTNTLIVRNLVGVAMDYCGPDTFFDTVNNPPTYDIRPLVFSLTGFNVTSTNVPTTGLTSDTVKDEVIQRAAAFFNCVFTQTNASCSATQ